MRAIQGIDGRAGRIDFGRRRVSDADQLRHALERDPRLVQADLALVDVPARCFGLCFGERHRRALRLVVQARQHLSFADRHAFFDVHLHDLAGNLRRHGGPAAGGDISRGVQDGGLCAGLALCDRSDFDLDGPFAREPPPGAAARCQTGRGGAQPIRSSAGLWA